MKFDWFEILKFLEKHAKNNDEFSKKLLTMTQQDAADLCTELNIGDQHPLILRLIEERGSNEPVCSPKGCQDIVSLKCRNH